MPPDCRSSQIGLWSAPVSIPGWRRCRPGPSAPELIHADPQHGGVPHKGWRFLSVVHLNGHVQASNARPALVAGIDCHLVITLSYKEGITIFLPGERRWLNSFPQEHHDKGQRKEEAAN